MVQILFSSSEAFSPLSVAIFSAAETASKSSSTETPSPCPVVAPPSAAPPWDVDHPSK